MAFTQQELREMRENSRIGAAKQRLKEEAALKKYMDNRKEDIKKTMTVNERIKAVAEAKQRGLSNQEIANELGIKYETVCTYICKARKDGLLEYADKPAEQSGVIDAAELTAAEREALVEEISAEISAEQEQPAEPKNEDSTAQMYEYACAIATMLKKLTIGKPFEVTLRAEESLYYLDVYAPNGTDSVEITWSRKAEAEDE